MSKFQNRYWLSKLPAWRECPPSIDDHRPDPDLPAYWSGFAEYNGARGFVAPPAIGTRVMCRGGFGVSTVRGYFVEEGYLGVHVRPDVRPEWHVRQARTQHTVCMFGVDLTVPADAPAAIAGS